MCCLCAMANLGFLVLPAFLTIQTKETSVPSGPIIESH